MTAVPCPAAPAGAPLPGARRIDSLDLLRGGAILGIFLMNAWSYAMPQYAYTDPNIYTTAWVPGQGFPEGREALHGAELAVYAIVHLLADMKFITVFSILFGAGILLQGERAAARGLSPARIHYARMLVLLLFGLIHAYALWYGDILYGYACCGLLLFPLRKLRPTFQLVLGVLMIAMVTVISMAVMSEAPVPLLGNLTDWNYNLLNGVGGNDYELAVYRGGWLQQILLHRGIESFAGQTYGFATWTFWRCGGAILMGMALHQRKFFLGAWPRAAYATIAALAVPIGWAITGVGIFYNAANGWDDSSDVFSVWGFGSEFNYWGSLVTALGYLSLGVLVATDAAEPARAWLHKCLWPLRAVGRTALSNYIAQSLIATTLFYGHGLGLFGALSRVQLLYVVAGVWMLQLVLTPLYLKFFRQGPLEWLWHRLVYWRGEPPPLKDMAEVA